MRRSHLPDAEAGHPGHTRRSGAPCRSGSGSPFDRPRQQRLVLHRLRDRYAARDRHLVRRRCRSCDRRPSSRCRSPSSLTPARASTSRSRTPVEDAGRRWRRWSTASRATLGAYARASVAGALELERERVLLEAAAQLGERELDRALDRLAVDRAASTTTRRPPPADRRCCARTVRDGGRDVVVEQMGRRLGGERLLAQDHESGILAGENRRRRRTRCASATGTRPSGIARREHHLGAERRGHRGEARVAQEAAPRARIGATPPQQRVGARRVVAVELFQGADAEWHETAIVRRDPIASHAARRARRSAGGNSRPPNRDRLVCAYTASLRLARLKSRTRIAGARIGTPTELDSLAATRSGRSRRRGCAADRRATD